MKTEKERIDYITQQYVFLEDRKHEFAKKNGFAYKRAQDFKNCVLIKWKWVNSRRKTSNQIDYAKLNEYVDLCHKLRERYNLFDEQVPLMETDLVLIKAGIYCFTNWHNKCWAIPNENEEVKNYVLNNVPNWGEVVEK